jgi:hypothetical protein
MPYTIRVSPDEPIVYLTMSDPLSSQDLEKSTAEMQRLYDNSERILHIVTDVRRLRVPPMGVLSVRNSPTFSHPRSGFVAVIGATYFGKTILNMLNQLIPSPKIKLFATPEEAEAHIRSVIAEDELKA